MSISMLMPVQSSVGALTVVPIAISDRNHRPAPCALLS
jgi:hypothetical protein